MRSTTRHQELLQRMSCTGSIALVRDRCIVLFFHAFSLCLLLGLATSCDSEVQPEHSRKTRDEKLPVVPIPSILDETLRTYIESLAKVVASNPSDSKALGRLAMTYDANGFDRAAENTYRRALEQAPEAFKWQYLLALRLQKNGDLREAIEVAKRAVQHERTYPAIYVRLGNWLIDDGQSRAAHVMFESAIELGAGPVAELGAARALLKSGDFESALERIQSVVSRTSHPMAFRLLSDAWRAMGEVRKSREYLAQAIDTKSMWFDDPLLREMLTHAKGTNNRVQDIELMLGSGLVDDALTTLHEMEAEGISDVDMQYRFALAYLQDRSFDLAKHRLLKAIELEPVHYPSHLLLASLYQREDDNVKAAEHLEHVLTIYPKLQIAYQELGFVRLRLGDREGALQSFENAIDLDSIAPNVHYYAGVILGAQGACDRAVKKFESALAIDGTHEKARLGLLECVNALSESNTTIDQSLTVKPQSNDGSSD